MVPVYRQNITIAATSLLVMQFLESQVATSRQNNEIGLRKCQNSSVALLWLFLKAWSRRPSLARLLIHCARQWHPQTMLEWWMVELLLSDPFWLVSFNTSLPQQLQHKYWGWERAKEAFRSIVREDAWIKLTPPSLQRSSKEKCKYVSYDGSISQASMLACQVMAARYRLPSPRTSLI